ncbi:MAG: 3'-5' exonuclease domain-containing protein 2, partial [Muribaculaceae bacterium]|nr:3'-5' exonuclease domain-containing protein 2 [Muribaculaceae bacterium]
MEQNTQLQTISKEDLARLDAEEFKGRIVLVQTESTALKAMRYLMEQPVVGFDTETRPGSMPRSS